MTEPELINLLKTTKLRDTVAALDKAGVKTTVRHNATTECYTRIAQHPYISYHNSQLKSNQVLNTLYYDLYRVNPEDADVIADPYLLVTGRIGDTTCRAFSL